jgi:hypothetical protein
LRRWRDGRQRVTERGGRSGAQPLGPYQRQADHGHEGQGEQRQDNAVGHRVGYSPLGRAAPCGGGDSAGGGAGQNVAQGVADGRQEVGRKVKGVDAAAVESGVPSCPGNER